MRIKVGDQVRFLNEVGGGKVKRIIDRQLAEIMTHDGWPIPYQISELVVVPDDPAQQPYRASSPQEIDDQSGKKTGQPGDANSEVNVVLLFTRELNPAGGITKLNAFLVNDSDHILDFAVYVHEGERIDLLEKESLEPGTKMQVIEMTLEQLSDCKGFRIQGLLSYGASSNLPPIINRHIPFQPKKFTAQGAFVENDYLHDAALSFNLTDDQTSENMNERIFQKEITSLDQGPPSFKSGNTKKATREIDLHINQLVDTVIGLSNREIIRIQMDHFLGELNQAIESNEREIIFIHGIGNGTLKESLRKTIDKDYPICSHEDASFKQYGFGATRILIRQNK